MNGEWPGFLAVIREYLHAADDDIAGEGSWYAVSVEHEQSQAG